MITLRDIIGNMSKGQSALNVRAILNSLDNTYSKLKSFISITGCDRNGTDGVTIFLSVPSQTHKNKKYTIAIWAKSQTKMNLDTPIKVYSNSPSFCWVFAYVFHRKGSLLFPEKYPKEFKTMEPKMRNLAQSAAFDKHVYCAIKYISHYKIPKIIAQFDDKTIPSIPTIKFVKNRNTGKIELIS